MKQLKLSRLFSLLLALTLALTPCLAGLAEEGNESQNSMDIVLMSGTEDGAGEGTGEGGSGADGGDQPTNVPVTGVTVTPNAIPMWVGTDTSFTVNVSPEGATNKNWTSSTSNASIASLSGKSTIHAVAPGTAIITVTTEDGKKTATITVTVTQQVGEIRLSADKTTLKVGGTAKVTANVLPENASNKGVTFTSSHSTVATVDANGNVQAASAGTTTITATAADGKGAYGTITIKVEDMATGVTLSPTSKELKVNETAQLAASVLPATANQGIKFTSSDETVATVSETGLVTARKEGTAVITATAADGSEKSASCTIKVGATAVDVPVTGITLDQPEITIEVLKDAKQLKATVEPANATNKDVVFSSSNTNVAVVSNTGLVTAINNGTATITVTSKENPSIMAKCLVKVGAPVLVTDVTVQPAELNLKTDGTYQLSVSVLPSNADERGVTFESSNTAVATVSASGLITAKGPGTATITVTAKDGSGKKATCTVTVTQPVKGVTVSPSSVVIQKDNVQKLTASVVPENATNKKLIYKSSNETVAVVSNDGIITARSEGWATITVCSEENQAIYGTCTVKVGLPVYVTKITLDTTNVTMWAGATRQLGVSIEPANADIKNVTYGSSNPDVATVSSNGLITAKKKGTATITVTATDGSGKSASCAVIVKQPVTGIQITPNGFTLVKGDVKDLKANVSPADADNPDVIWTSSNTNIAAVSSKGQVTAVNEGSCVITATCKDNASISASCTIVVGTPVTSVALAPNRASMNTGETILITASVLPTNASNKGIIWSWKSEDGASIILTNGAVKAMKAGTVTVTAKAADNSGKEAYCTITITGTAIATPTPTPAPTVTPTPGPTGGIWCRVNTEKGALNVRDKIGGAVIDKIPEKGTFLVVNWGTTWCQVYYNGRYGYVMTKFVQKISSEPTAAPTPAPTAPMGQTAQVNTAKGALNMRDKIGGAVIAKIPEKAFFIVTEYGATWCKAWYDGKTGYVMTKFVKLTGGSMPTPTPVPTPEPIIDYARATTANGGLNLRDAINGTRIAVIPQGATVSVHSKGADWCRVSYSGKTGYVMTKFLTFGSAAPTETPIPAPEVVISYARVNTVTGGLNLRETPNGTRIAVIPQNAVIGVITKGADWSRVKYGDKVGYVMTKFLADTTATPAPSTPAPGNTLQCYGKVTTANGGGLNMRSGPATTYGRIASIKNGGVVEVYDKGAVWSRIKYNGTFGYVMSQYLTFSAERPSENPDPVIPSGAKAQVTTTAGSLNMRAGMGTTYALIGKIPQKAYVEVLTYGPSWCYVSYNGLKGYVMTTYLTMIN
ncbi:MAG: Ig-like domain-containing protein [Clostridiales bacterium]|nr:Ig-like domain-containing protein [Clostridiales bacterium]MDY5469006.1 Ig-like domain-containing protein [Eubacteriales bacterium]